jgi:DNA-binding transcriptional regulator YhcF (GntR family)
MPLSNLPYAHHSDLLSGALSKQENQGILRTDKENAHSVTLTNPKKKSKALSKDYSGLVSDMKAGVKDFRTLAKKHKVNINTLQKYSKKIQNGEL